MKKKYSRKHIGKERKTNEGCEIKIVNGGSKKSYCTIRFYNPINYTKEILVDTFKNGSVKNDYLKTVFGIGFFGIGKHKTRIKGRKSDIYNIWYSMMSRCYDKTAKDYVNYGAIGVCVCEEWHNFQFFADWYEGNFDKTIMFDENKKRWQIDKDILSKNTKIYSPETCCFIPNTLNKLLTTSNKSNTSGFMGVTKEAGKWRARIQINNKKVSLGSFDTPKEASKAYKRRRRILIHEWKKKCHYDLKIPYKIWKRLK